MKTYKADCEAIEIDHMGDAQTIGREKRKVDDQRIHLMLYFFEGHHTKEQDFLSVKAFAEHTNVIPIIAKGDQYTVDELKQVKKDIINKAKEMKVGFFDA